MWPAARARHQAQLIVAEMVTTLKGTD
jgi:hypothetical protein